MLNIIEIVLPVFLVILIGYIFGKVKKTDMSGVLDLTIYIGVPSLIFTSILKRPIILEGAVNIWLSSLFVMAGSCILAVIVFFVLRQKHSGLYVPISLMNALNLPFPIIFLAWGEEGIFLATLFVIPNAIAIYSWGVFQSSKKSFKEGIKEIFKVPLIYAALFGLVLNLLKVELPSIILSPLEFISMMAIPLVLVTLGYNLVSIKMKSIPTTLLASFLRVGGGLALGILISHLLGLEGMVRSIVIFESAMPAAMFSAVLAARYKNESGLVSSVVFVSTLMSLVMIPLLLIFLM